MAAIPRDETREDRIHSEIIVDAYDREEQVMGWYTYLEEKVGYADQPLLARCVAERAISPLQVGDEVEILDMAPADECKGEMFVMIRWGVPGGKRGLGVPLSQLQIDSGDASACEAAEDWRYWVQRGYEF